MEERRLIANKVDSLHKHFTRWRVLPVTVLIFVMALTVDMTYWYQEHAHSLTEWQNAPIIGYLTMLVGVIAKFLDNVSKAYEKDNI